MFSKSQNLFYAQMFLVKWFLSFDIRIKGTKKQDELLINMLRLFPAFSTIPEIRNLDEKNVKLIPFSEYNVLHHAI